MASELQLKWIETGITAYAIVYNATGQSWNGSAFEDFTAANIGTYDVAMAETDTASYQYIGDMPAGAAALAESFSVHKQAGGSPAVSDTLIGTENYRLNAAALASIQSGLATSAELAKVPKSDGTVSHNATAIAAITAAMEAAILDEGDATALLAAIAAKIEEFMINEGDATATLQGIATAVWANATRTLTAGTNLNIPAASAIADAVCDEALSGHATAGTVGKALSDTLADTNELQTDWADGGRLDALIDAILVDTGSLNDTVLPEITSETDIPATPTLRQAIMLGYMLSRNDTQATATLRKLLNNAGAVVVQGTMADDGTTFNQGKLVNP